MKEFFPFLKLVLIGDSTVGKTFLLSTFATNKLPITTVPTLFDNQTTQVVVDGQEFELTVWDTAGADERKYLRSLAYPKTDVFLVCYAVDDRDSFKHVETKWVPELRKYCPTVPIVLIGLKSDLREKAPDPVKANEGELCYLRINASAFFECSVKNRHNLQAIFAEATRAALRRKFRDSKRNSCIIS